MQELSGEPHTQPSLLSFPYWKRGPGYEATIRSTQGGYLHPGRRIPITTFSAGRRGKSVSKGKAKLGCNISNVSLCYAEFSLMKVYTVKLLQYCLGHGW